MAARLGLVSQGQLQHFIAGPAWDDGPLWTELAGTAGRPLVSLGNKGTLPLPAG